MTTIEDHVATMTPDQLEAWKTMTSDEHLSVMRSLRRAGACDVGTCDEDWTDKLPMTSRGDRYTMQVCVEHARGFLRMAGRIR